MMIQRDSGFALIIIAVALTIGLTLLAVRVDPTVALAVVISVPLIIGVILRSSIRLALVVVGALLVFQSSSDALKYVYLGFAILCVAVSAMGLLKRRDLATKPFMPLFVASPVLLIYLVFSSSVAISNGASTTDWFRDVLPYILIAILPIVGLDASREVRPGRMEMIIGALSAICAVGLALDWLERRGASSLGVGRVILSTFALVSFGFALGVTRAGLGPKRLLWMLVVIVIGTAMILSGSRTNLVIFIAIIAVLGSSARARVGLLRMILNGVAAIASIGFLVVTFGGVLIQQSGFLQGRLDALLAALNGGAAADGSYAARELSYAWDWNAFQNHLLLGTGPGYRYPDGLFGSDAATLILAKWGIVGSVVLLSFLVAVVVCVRRSRAITGALPIHTAAFGWAVVLIALLPLGPWLEDKGFALALTLLVTAVAASTRLHAVEPKISATKDIGNAVAAGAARSAQLL